MQSILVCDDEAALATEIGEFFESHGWQARTCVSASQARDILLQGFRTTCLLTDLRLGSESGADLISFARRLPPTTRPQCFAVLTGHAIGSEDRYGADLLYFKPVDPFEMLAEVDHLVSRSGGAAERSGDE